jgi:diguanylate cyclase (GGDEF)-like protein/PAS domain S-box-containing protein
VNEEKSTVSIEKYNRVLFNVNNFMVEQTETADYNQLVSLVVDQLDKLLRPIAITYNEYNEQNRTYQIIEIKANQGMLDIFLKVSGKKLSSLTLPSDDQIFEEIKAERVKLLPNLHEASGRAIPKTIASEISKAIGINCYLGLSYVIDDQVFGTTVIALREEPEQTIVELLKAYAYFTSLSLKRIFADQALKQTEHELRNITDNITDVVAMADLEGRFVYISESSHAVFGYKPEELIGKSIIELVHEDDIARVGITFQEGIAEGKKNASTEHRVRHKNGHYIWVEAVGKLVIDDNGQPAGALFTSRDISDRKQAEQKLQFQAEILDSIGDLVTATDPDGKILYVNQAECMKFGKTRDELIGKTTEIYGEDPKYGALQKEIVEATYEKGFWRGEVVNYDKDNNPFYLDCRTWGMRDADCVVHTLIGIATDITDSKKAEEALRVSEEKYRQIADNISDVVWVTDAELNTVYISPSVEKLIGESVDCHMARSLEERFPPDSLNKLLHAFHEEMEIDPLAEKNRTRIFEVQHYKADGSIIWVSMHLSAIRDEDGNITGLQGSTRDITERKQAEKALRESESRYRKAQELGKVGNWEYNLETAELWGSDEAQKIFEYDSDESSFNIEEVESCIIERERVHQSLVDLIENSKPYNLEYDIITKNTGKIKTIISVAELEKDKEGKPLKVSGVIQDITDRKKAEERIIHIGFHDQLTDLYNRHYFEACEEDLKKIPLLSVIMTDVNGLKLINDTYGHGAGDELLKKYADLLRKSFKQSDLIFRWGGDEFIIILKNTEETKSWELCNRLVKYCGETFVKDIPLSISVGISSKLQGGNIHKAIQEAEDMMYKHKLIESKSSKNLIMKTLQQALAEKSFETKEHIDRMTSVGRQFGEKLSLSPSELSRLETLTMLHDIGKINIDSHILLKETALSDEEWKEIKKHPEVGYRITRTTEEFAYIAEDILAHHERWDGKGYPQNLEGDSIPYLARILNIIDSYDVMINGRPYKEKMSLAEVIEEIERCSGKQFDPDLAEVFVAFLKEEATTYQQ